jgi:hypothetical protein
MIGGQLPPFPQFFFRPGRFIQKSCRRNIERGSFDWKLQRLVPFLIVESDWKATSPFPLRPSFSNDNFEIAILSII